MSEIISLLPDHIANQIAAGEVIQRPASAVKELMENAIDAGATRMHLIIRDAGKELIQLIDDGKGMSPLDARMCFERHATSKINTIEDLFRIRTMGFRGEALASIAAVAQVELKTRRPDDEVATLLVVENSQVRKQEICQAPVGTNLSIKNLFFNVPARRNFLKSASTEMRHILDEFTRIALAFPEIAFRLTNNQTDVFNLESGKLKQRVLGLLGQQLNTKLVPVDEPTDLVSIRGFIGAPDTAARTRGNQFFFVNNRFIRSHYLNHAVSQAYSDLIEKDAFPLFVLFVDIDPARVDINVHPTKQEIKFEDERIVYSFVHAAIRHALSKYSIAPSIDFSLDAGITSLPAVTQPFTTNKQTETKEDYLFQSFTEKGKAHFLEKSGDTREWKSLYKIQSALEAPPHESSSESVSSAETLPLQQEEFKSTFLQINQAYLVVSTRYGFLLIDQQLAHQRILFEQFRKSTASTQVSQQLLVPQTLGFSPADSILFTELLPDLLEIGYVIEPFGQDTFILQGLPADVKPGDEKRSLEKLLESFKQESTGLKLDRRERLYLTLATQRSITHGKSLGIEEMQELFAALFRCEQPMFTPGGKKIFAKFGAQDLEKLLQHS
ncbi:MAG: DNA mismatch repair endonuclease MutL [Chitinophagaceae bacterium]|nr:DNA mismatch repair endonuclease MutL [Chitinophagaceae bacterium]